MVVAQEADTLVICLSNTVREDPGQVESNRIGLRTCEKILRQMGGTFSRTQEGALFSATLTLPAADAPGG